MRILVASNFSRRARRVETSRFAGRADVDFLDMQIAGAPSAPLLPWSEALQRIRRGAYGMAFIQDPVRLWNPRKALLSNLLKLGHKAVHGYPLLRLHLLLRNLAKFSVPVGGIDMEDTPVIDNALFGLLEGSDVYFKRELPTNPANAFIYTSDRAEDPGNIPRTAFFRRNLPKLRPLSLGISDALFDKLAAYRGKKDIDVFFAGSTRNRPARQSGMVVLKKLAAEGFRVVAPEEKLPPAQYYETAARSLVCWSPEGFGYDCNRTYEVAALGSAPLLKVPPILPLAPFGIDKEALYYMHESVDMLDRLRGYLREPEKLEAIGAAAREHVRRYHRYSCVADYMIDSLRGARGRT